MSVIISSGNTKIGKVPNVSMTPIESCGNCEMCKRKCYALQSYRQYPSVRKAWDNNYGEACKDMNNYFSDIDAWLEENRPEYFRWHVAGDILGLIYLHNMISIAERQKYTEFLCFTKMYGTVARVLNQVAKPENLSLVLSVWPGLDFHNPHNLPLAFCQDGTEERHIEYNPIGCPGYCTDCMLCWGTNNNVMFDIH